MSHFGSHAAWLRLLREQASGWVPLPTSQGDKSALGHLPLPHPPPRGLSRSSLRPCFLGLGSGSRAQGVRAVLWVPE